LCRQWRGDEKRAGGQHRHALVALHTELSDRLARAREPFVFEPSVAAVPSVEMPASPEVPRRSSGASRPIAAMIAATIVLIALVPSLMRARRTAAGDDGSLIVAGIESPSRAADDVWLEAGLPRAS
jgi:hypothetical protein